MCLSLALLVASSAVWANSGTTHSLSVDQIHVGSDGESYVSVSPFEWDARITIDAGQVGGIKKYTYWVDLEVEGMPTNLSLKPFAASRSYGIGDRPDTVNATVGSLVAPSLSASGWFSAELFAKVVCNNQKAALRARGWSDERIFSQRHVIAARAIDRWDVEFTVDDYLDIIVEGSYWFTEIVCESTPEMAGQVKRPPQPPAPASRNFAVPFQISAATISVDPSQARGPCPMNLEVTARLTAVGEGTASFRLLHNGAPGPVRKVTFGQGGTKQDTATFEVGAPASGPAFEAASGGSGGASGTTMANPTNPNQQTGRFAIRVVAPNAVESEEAFYSVGCVKPGPSSGPARLQARPAPNHQPGLRANPQASDPPGRRPSPEPAEPQVRLSPLRRDTCRGVRLEVEAGDGAAPQTYEAEWQQRDGGSWKRVRVAGFDRMPGPQVDTRVPRSAMKAAATWRVRVRSQRPLGPWSGWESLDLARCGAPAGPDESKE